MNSFDYYRARAAECVQRANNSVSPDDKAEWMKLAADFLALIPQSVGQQQQQIQPKPDKKE